jgi:hypothetical protein
MILEIPRQTLKVRVRGAARAILPPLRVPGEVRALLGLARPPHVAEQSQPRARCRVACALPTTSGTATKRGGVGWAAIRSTMRRYATGSKSLNAALSAAHRGAVIRLPACGTMSCPIHGAPGNRFKIVLPLASKIIARPARTGYTPAHTPS